MSEVQLGLWAQIAAAVVLYPWIAGRVARWLLPHGWRNCHWCGQPKTGHPRAYMDGTRHCRNGTDGFYSHGWQLAVIFWPVTVALWTAIELLILLVLRPVRALFLLGHERPRQWVSRHEAF